MRRRLKTRIPLLTHLKGEGVREMDKHMQPPCQAAPFLLSKRLELCHAFTKSRLKH